MLTWGVCGGLRGPRGGLNPQPPDKSSTEHVLFSRMRVLSHRTILLHHINVSHRIVSHRIVSYTHRLVLSYNSYCFVFRIVWHLMITVYQASHQIKAL